MSIFGSSTFDGQGGFNSGSQASGTLNVVAGSLIVTCFAFSISDEPLISITDTAGNSYTLASLQNDGTTAYQWAYCLSAAADATTVITATSTGSGGFCSLSTWVVPITGSALFDVLFGIGVMSGSGTQSTASANTSGSDEFIVCTCFDRNGSVPYTAVSPATIDNGNYASTRAAAEHATYNSVQTGITLGMVPNGSAAGGITAIAFKAGNISANVTATDTLSFSETLTRQTAAPRATSYSASFSDTLTRLVAVGKFVADSESFSEMLSRATGIAKGLSDIFSFLDSLSLQDDAAVPVFGFSPNYYFDQQSQGLAIYISPGIINGVMFNGQAVFVPANATTNISINSAGVVSLSFGPHLYPIATVVTGQVVTSGSTGKNANTDNGILSISDQRPTGSFSF